MQAVIAVKPSETIAAITLICGVPLLERVILTAVRSGCKRVVLLCPPSLPGAAARARLRTPRLGGAEIDTVDLAAPFDEADAEQWHRVSGRLEDRFLWMPWGYIPHRNALAELLGRAVAKPRANVRFAFHRSEPVSIFDVPAVLVKSELADGCGAPLETLLCEGEPGLLLRGPADVAHAERELVRRSGKVTDGIYSRFNRWLCRPAVRWLSRTRITPNAVTFGGLAVALLSGMLFARGTWLSNVAAAILFFVSGLFDEIDGMLARIKFQESPFGCWLETMVDYTTYVVIFVGMTIGGYHRSGPEYLLVGAALLIGSLLSFWVISIQRKLAAPASRPNEYSRRYLAALDRDGKNLISRAVRQLQFLTKKGVLVHYLLLFAVFGLLPLFLTLAALGANIAWMVTIYLNFRLFSGHSRALTTSQRAVAAEVKR
ncbi:MAG TPA: CDP-alcohol phosphatidyltransferase family protein [Bryobacteraceae bacterium]|nr:CDP-alcohol phosphatidyltransferase family protein [Bryobacteraceae bacterium]